MRHGGAQIVLEKPGRRSSGDAAAGRDGKWKGGATPWGVGSAALGN